MVAKADPKLSAIDLNLLVVFDAVMKEGNVTRAARRLGSSQSTVSHALGRLRHMLKDELFVPGPSGMQPTPRAEHIHVPIREALAGLGRALEPISFDPVTSREQFHIAADIYASVVLAPLLTRRAHDIAPNIELDFRPSLTMDPWSLLEGDHASVAIGTFPDVLDQRYRQEVLVQDEFVAVLRKNHPAAGAPSLSVERFAAIPQIEMASPAYQTQFIADALAKQGLKRQVVLRAPTISAILMLLDGDYMFVGRRRAVEVMLDHHPFVVRQLPFASSVITTGMVWPRRIESVPSHRWLRQQLVAAARELPNETAVAPGATETSPHERLG